MLRGFTIGGTFSEGLDRGILIASATVSSRIIYSRRSRLRGISLHCSTKVNQGKKEKQWISIILYSVTLEFCNSTCQFCSFNREFFKLRTCTIDRILNQKNSQVACNISRLLSFYFCMTFRGIRGSEKREKLQTLASNKLFVLEPRDIVSFSTRDSQQTPRVLCSLSQLGRWVISISVKRESRP